MCYTNPRQVGYHSRYSCVYIKCMICFNDIGLACNSTDVKIDGRDLVVCGICNDMNIDRVIEEVLEVVV